MKKTFFLFSFLAVLITACQQTPEPAPVDRNAEEAAINAVCDSIVASFKAQDVEQLMSHLADTLLFLGSDPSEIWNRDQLTEMWTQMLASTPVEIKLINDRKIFFAPDGKTAAVVEDYYMPMFSEVLPFRNVYHMIREDGNWKIMFSGTGIIAKNEDLPKIDAVLMEE